MLQSRRLRFALLAACLLMIPTTAMAQEGTIAGTVRDDQAAVTFKAVGTEPAPNQIQLQLSLEVGGEAAWTQTLTRPNRGMISLRWLAGDQAPRGLVKVGDKYAALPLQVHVTADGPGPVTAPPR